MPPSFEFLSPGSGRGILQGVPLLQCKIFKNNKIDVAVDRDDESKLQDEAY